MVRDPRSVLAREFLAACRARGLTPDPRLRLIVDTAPVVETGLVGDTTVTSAPVAAIELAGPHDLGPRHEQLVSGTAQVRRGAWYTPRWLAEQLVAEVVTDVGIVADPACGGGVFLLAAADRLVALGANPGEVVAQMVWGADIDADAVAVSEAALWWWSAEAGEPTVAGDRIVVGDTLTTTTIPPSMAVVGNPPFLGQLRRRTSADDDRRAALQARWGRAVQAYTDPAWLFLLAATEALVLGGAAVLVQPQSILGARDGAEVRLHIDALARLEACWIDDGKTFAVAVDCCAPRLRRRAADPAGDDAAGPGSARAHDNDWTSPLATAQGVPSVHLDATRTVGDMATVIAGFRDEYYGLVPAVREGGAGPRLVTSGAIDPLETRTAPVRFAKRPWDEPRIDATALSGRAAGWVEAQRTSKVVIANQTRVLEAIVDESGAVVAGVPAIVVVPDDPDDVWLLAAAIHAPVASAWMVRNTAGTALAATACRPTAAWVAALPLPVDLGAWRDAAEAARALSEHLARRGGRPSEVPVDGAGDLAGGDGSSVGDVTLAERWDAFAVLADRAYGVDDPEVRVWWKSRLPLR